MLLSTTLPLLENATKESISFLANKKYQKYINTTSANAVIVSTHLKQMIA